MTSFPLRRKLERSAWQNKTVDTNVLPIQAGTEMKLEDLTDA